MSTKDDHRATLTSLEQNKSKVDHKITGFDFKQKHTLKELNTVITAVDELKDRGGRPKNPNSDI